MVRKKYIWLKEAPLKPIKNKGQLVQYLSDFLTSSLRVSDTLTANIYIQYIDDIFD